ncbi:MAG TPA: MBOAT family protein [Candidatus Hydrogenedentes bacterium]|nr:MBOAT family protein [Candidatus Hydrogenedentota bacterium]
MVFSSHLFLFYFLPPALAMYYTMPKRAKHLALTLLSYIFYGWANPYFVFLMLGSTLVDYCCGRVIARGLRVALAPDTPRTCAQRLAIIVSICTNLGLLGFFKYFNFGIDSYNALVGALGVDAIQWHTFFRVTLPLGISFYTFQSMSYTIDVYRGDARAIRNFTDFACYVSMFPQLVAGPIVRFHEVADQLESRTHTIEKCARGVSFVCLGLAKKILIANACGKIADMCFHAGAVSPLDAWYGLFGYAFQIYFDFSAYSDMAIGFGLMLGFTFPKNFDSPYRSESITEFWRRWHQSLSTWLRDYLYIPLGGNKKGTTRTYVNLAMVMLLGGLWHGAAWNFVIWGGIHGAMLAFERAMGKDSLYRRAPRPLRVALTFLIVCFAWVFFRAPDLPSALGYLGNLFGVGPKLDGMHLVSGVIYQPYYMLTMVLAVLITWGAPQTWDFTRRLTWSKALLCVAMLLISIAVLATQAFNPFIYFIF